MIATVLPRSVAPVRNDLAEAPLRSRNSISTKPIIASVASVMGVIVTSRPVLESGGARSTSAGMVEDQANFDGARNSIGKFVFNRRAIILASNDRVQRNSRRSSVRWNGVLDGIRFALHVLNHERRPLS